MYNSTNEEKMKCESFDLKSKGKTPNIRGWHEWGFSTEVLARFKNTVLYQVNRSYSVLLLVE